MGLFFALAIVLSYVESSFPPIPMFPPGVKLGLSNVVVMYCLFFLGKSRTILILICKSLFVFLTRGALAASLSFGGGLVSFLVMCLLMFIFKDISFLLLSVAGAITHNVSQLLIVCAVFGNLAMLYYMPVIIVTGIFAGLGTATVLKFIMPAFDRLNNKK